MPKDDEADGDACGKCQSCKQALSGNQPDIIRVTHEKPASISVDEIREQVNNDIVIKPYSSRYKVYIIADADMMTVQAQNALLKTIEEPPEYAVILLIDGECGSAASDDPFPMRMPSFGNIKATSL